MPIVLKRHINTSSYKHQTLPTWTEPGDIQQVSKELYSQAFTIKDYLVHFSTYLVDYPLFLQYSQVAMYVPHGLHVSLDFTLTL